jgi:hypothetical protein
MLTGLTVLGIKLTVIVFGILSLMLVYKKTLSSGLLEPYYSYGIHLLSVFGILILAFTGLFIALDYFSNHDF